MAIESQDELKRILADTKTIAVVGASTDPAKAAHTIPRYLQSQGFRIIPVNPRGGELFGERVYARLADIAEPVDVVNVFRPSAETPGVALEAVKIGARVLWLQLGIASEEAERIASAGGLKVVMNLCLGETYRQFNLGPEPEDGEG